MELTQQKTRAALLSIFSNSSLIIFKLFVGIITGSVSVISEAVHSFSDLLASFVAYFSVKKASEPADADHEFGHGKYEDLSGLIEGVLIFLAAVYIVHEAASKIFNSTNIHLETTPGIVVMLISTVVNIFVSRHLFKVGHKTESLALIADGEHLRTDVYTSAGILAALIIIKITGFTILDPIIAILVALIILKVSLELCFRAVKNLLDTSLPKEEKIIIIELLKHYVPGQILDIQKIKTRRSGAERLVELILTVHGNLTIRQGHDLCDKIEKDLMDSVGNIKVTIHLEPCSAECPVCTRQ